ncbi:hypothetical protein K438DRAFT_1749850 [Mycena galopus ATCC 62051]|nr:hypothetical protein K438DRAFT_1749850 [Mycena galopus ATCC 62051]
MKRCAEKARFPPSVMITPVGIDPPTDLLKFKHNEKRHRDHDVEIWVKRLASQLLTRVRIVTGQDMQSLTQKSRNLVQFIDSKEGLTALKGPLDLALSSRQAKAHGGASLRLDRNRRLERLLLLCGGPGAQHCIKWPLPTLAVISSLTKHHNRVLIGQFDLDSKHARNAGIRQLNPARMGCWRDQAPENS